MHVIVLSGLIVAVSFIFYLLYQPARSQTKTKPGNAQAASQATKDEKKDMKKEETKAVTEEKKVVEESATPAGGSGQAEVAKADVVPPPTDEVDEEADSCDPNYQTLMMMPSAVAAFGENRQPHHDTHVFDVRPAARRKKSKKVAEAK